MYKYIGLITIIGVIILIIVVKKNQYPYFHYDIDITRSRRASFDPNPLVFQFLRSGGIRAVKAHKQKQIAWRIKHLNKRGDDDHAYQFRFVRRYSTGKMIVDHVVCYSYNQLMTLYGDTDRLLSALEYQRQLDEQKAAALSASSSVVPPNEVAVSTDDYVTPIVETLEKSVVETPKRRRSYGTPQPVIEKDELKIVETAVESKSTEEVVPANKPVAVEKVKLDTTGIDMLPLHPEKLPDALVTYLNEKLPLTTELFMKGYAIEKRSKKVCVPGCYIIYDLNEDKYYVGQASDLWRRVREHIVGKTNRKGLYQQIDANILAGHTVLIRLMAIGTGGVYDLNEMERLLIAAYDSVDPRGYNLTKGNG